MQLSSCLPVGSEHCKWHSLHRPALLSNPALVQCCLPFSTALHFRPALPCSVLPCFALLCPTLPCAALLPSPAVRPRPALRPALMPCPDAPCSLRCVASTPVLLPRLVLPDTRSLALPCCPTLPCPTAPLAPTPALLPRLALPDTRSPAQLRPALLPCLPLWPTVPCSCAFTPQQLSCYPAQLCPVLPSSAALPFCPAGLLCPALLCPALPQLPCLPCPDTPLSPRCAAPKAVLLAHPAPPCTDLLCPAPCCPALLPLAALPCPALLPCTAVQPCPDAPLSPHSAAPAAPPCAAWYLLVPALLLCFALHCCPALAVQPCPALLHLAHCFSPLLNTCPAALRCLTPAMLSSPALP